MQLYDLVTFDGACVRKIVCGNSSVVTLLNISVWTHMLSSTAAFCVVRDLSSHSLITFCGCYL